MSVGTDLLTVREAAQLIGCSEKTVTEQARRKRLAGHKKGKYWRIELASAERYRQELATRRPQPILEDPVALEKLYRELGTFQAVADAIGSSKETVGRYLHQHGIEITNRRLAATPPYVPEPVSLERWMDVAIIHIKAGLLKKGIRPPRPEEMCAPNCPGRGECLDGPCVMAGNGNGTGSA